MVADDKNSDLQNSSTFLLEKLNQIYADEQRTRKFDAETKKPNKQQPASLKSIMKNTTLRGLFAASLLLVSSNVFAQSAPVSETASASATVVQPITITNTGDLKFSTVAAGVSKTVNTLGQVTFGGNGIASGDEGAASFELSKAAEIPVLLTVSGLDSLAGDGGILATTFVVDAATALNATTADENFPASGETRVLQLGLATEALNEANTIFVRIGGTVLPKANQSQGLYSGTITLTAIYN